MYECNIVEVEDFGFNHYIHHIDEYEEFESMVDIYVYIDEDEEWK